MSTQVFPTFRGLGYSFHRTPQFSTIVQTAVSGKETRIGYWSTPRYTYELTFNVLKVSTQDLQKMQAFFLNRAGMGDSFLYNDDQTPDNTAIGVTLGTGDGVATNYQLVRTYGASGNPAFTDRVTAPNVVAAVYLDGGVVDPLVYTVSGWESALPGTITFDTAPTTGQVVTADFTFYWPVRFTDDTIDFEKFLGDRWLVQKLSFITIK